MTTNQKQLDLVPKLNINAKAFVPKVTTPTPHVEEITFSGNTDVLEKPNIASIEVINEFN